MKNFIPLLLLFISFSFTNKGLAQNEFITNGQFESWSGFFGIEMPNSWLGTNSLMIIDQSAPVTITKVGNPNQYAGNFSARIETKSYPNNPLAQFFFPEDAGFLLTASFNFSTQGIDLGYPYYGQPEGFRFWAKYEPNGSDTAFATANLLAWDSNLGTQLPVATANIIITQATQGYQQFSANFIYSNPSVMPDTAIVIFSSSEFFDPKIGSALTIDDAEFFGGTVGIQDLSGRKKAVAVFPNPASDFISFNVQDEFIDFIDIYSLEGKFIERINMNYRTEIQHNASSYSSGLYLYNCIKNDKVIESGKFCVNH
jgi:hypothetical protein